MRRDGGTLRACDQMDDFDGDESMDGDHETGLASAGWGTDEDSARRLRRLWRRLVMVGWWQAPLTGLAGERGVFLADVQMQK